MNEEDFIRLLVEQTPNFDEKIMADIRPKDGWLLNVATGCYDWQFERYVKRITAVRRISEGLAFKTFEVVLDDWVKPMGCPVKVTADRFRAVFPNTSQKWKKVTAL